MGGLLRRLLFGGGARGAAAQAPAPEPGISPARLDAALERLRELIPAPGEGPSDPAPDEEQPGSAPEKG